MAEAARTIHRPLMLVRLPEGVALPAPDVDNDDDDYTGVDTDDDDPF